MENGTEDKFTSMCLPDEVFEAEHGSSWMTTWRKKNLQRKRVRSFIFVALTATADRPRIIRQVEATASLSLVVF